MNDPAQRRNIPESLARAAPGTLFDAEDAREQIAEVRAFGDRATAILRSERLLDP